MFSPSIFLASVLRHTTTRTENPLKSGNIHDLFLQQDHFSKYTLFNILNKLIIKCNTPQWTIAEMLKYFLTVSFLRPAVCNKQRMWNFTSAVCRHSLKYRLQIFTKLNSIDIMQGSIYIENYTSLSPHHSSPPHFFKS